MGISKSKNKQPAQPAQYFPPMGPPGMAVPIPPGAGLPIPTIPPSNVQPSLVKQTNTMPPIVSAIPPGMTKPLSIGSYPGLSPPIGINKAIPPYPSLYPSSPPVCHVISGGSGFQPFNPFGMPFDKPNCPNELNDTDFHKVAMLAGLDVSTTRQLYSEFQQLTRGQGRLDREQFRNIVVRSLYHTAMQNLESVAEDTFRSFDRDKNGHLDFFDFIAAYKANSPTDVNKSSSGSSILKAYGL